MVPFFARENILQNSVGIFILRVVWAIAIVSETVPARTHTNKTRWTVENPISSISILFRNRLFITLTALIALTSVVSEGTFQIQTFYLNTVVGFHVTDFGNLMLFNGVIAIVSATQSAGEVCQRRDHYSADRMLLEYIRDCWPWLFR
ncbi:hypothetical protein PI125_g6667 [Phytophthora idaei]|nr:hypothetical protein PI125_g6667 [Phytophthora idaei]KAG3161534.1 hypothetical protein PI126_g6403 [Phytophthora idaei]